MFLCRTLRRAVDGGWREADCAGGAWRSDDGLGRLAAGAAKGLQLVTRRRSGIGSGAG